MTVTPDKTTYDVGETITLRVLGDDEGEGLALVVGRLLFTADLADYVSSRQEPLTTFGLRWATGRLIGGEGFADAFRQAFDPSGVPVDGPLMAVVTLTAAAPGILEDAWQTEGDPGDPDRNFIFGSLPPPPGGSVRIVPEPATGALVALGLLGLATTRRCRSEHRELRLGSSPHVR